MTTAASLANTSTDDLLLEKERRLCERLAPFVRRSWHVIEPGTAYRHNWHIDAVCDVLEGITAGHLRNVVINEPPRHMKSIKVTVNWPAWEWKKHPERRWIFCSYTQTLSIQHSIFRRQIIESQWYKRLYGDRVQLARDQNQKTVFANTAKGRMEATSIGGGITGKGGTRIIVDDPHNPMQALSETERQRAITFFGSTLLNRRDQPDESAVVIVMQRLHERDLTGHCVAELGYDHFVFKAEDGPKARIYMGWPGARSYERDDSGLLWPERFSKTTLDEMRKGMTDIRYAAQYQQAPVPEGGGILKEHYFRRVAVDAAPSDIVREVRFWDNASTEGGGDWTCGAKVALLRTGRFLIRDVHRGQWGPGDVNREILGAAPRDGGSCWVREEQEGGSSGPTVIYFRRRSLRGFNYEGRNARGSKESRYEMSAVHGQNGMIDILEAGWTEGALTELKTVPYAVNDDRADAICGAINELTDAAPSGPATREVDWG